MMKPGDLKLCTITENLFEEFLKVVKDDKRTMRGGRLFQSSGFRASFRIYRPFLF